jgi:hypothetical protein
MPAPSDEELAISMTFKEILLTQEPDVLMTGLHDMLHEMEDYIPSDAEAAAYFAIIEQRPDAAKFAHWLAYQRSLFAPRS